VEQFTKRLIEELLLVNWLVSRPAYYRSDCTDSEICFGSLRDIGANQHLISGSRATQARPSGGYANPRNI